MTVMRNSLHHNIPSPSPPINLQGIVTILRSDNTETNNHSSPASLRRTFSADMSSKKWLQQNGFFSPMKKISSSEVLTHSPEEETGPGQDEVWRTIQAQKESNGSTQLENVWGSILQSKKTDGSDHLPPPEPYVHPLVKRSASTLSEKSLEICTESLGSETGSEGFSAYPDSESSGDVDDQECLSLKGLNPMEDLHVVKYKESPVRPFPPPLNSIAGCRGDGALVHMNSRRENGRLVLEAVSVPLRNFFQAERRDGRLVLTLVDSPVSEKMEEVFDHDMEDVDEDGIVDEDGDEEETEEEEENIEQFEKDFGFVMERKTEVLMSKFIALRNKNHTWNTKINNKIMAAAAASAAEEEELVAAEEKPPVTQSLPPRPPAARLLSPPQPPTAASFNPYEYFWRYKSAAAAVSGGFGNNPQRQPLKLNKNRGNSFIKTHENHNQDLVLMRGNKTEYFVPYMKGCKETRRSVLIWEPFCIATS